jgi:anti-anti-sigma factor
MHLVELHGELDISRKARIEKELGRIRAFGPNSLTVLDLSNVVYADSTFLHALIRLHESLTNEAPGSSVCIVPSKLLVKLFQITGLDRMFPLFENVPSAQEYAIGLNRPSESEAFEEA